MLVHHFKIRESANTNVFNGVIRTIELEVCLYTDYLLSRKNASKPSITSSIHTLINADT